jgi:hypothetical protein
MYKIDSQFIYRLGGARAKNRFFENHYDSLYEGGGVK